MASVVIPIKDVAACEVLNQPDSYISKISDCDAWVKQDWIGWTDIWYAKEYRKRIVDSAKTSVTSSYNSCIAHDPVTLPTPPTEPTVTFTLATKGSFSTYGFSRGGLYSQLSIPFNDPYDQNNPNHCPLVPKEVFWKCDLSAVINLPKSGVYTLSAPMAGYLDNSGGAIDGFTFDCGLAQGQACGYGFKDTNDSLPFNTALDGYIGCYGINNATTYRGIESLHQMWQKAVEPTYTLKIDPLIAVSSTKVLYARPIPDNRVVPDLLTPPLFDVNCRIDFAQFYFNITYTPPSGTVYKTNAPMADLRTILQYNNGFIHLPDYDLRAVLTEQIITSLNVPVEETYAHGDHKIRVEVTSCNVGAYFSNAEDKATPLNFAYLGGAIGNGIVAVEKTYKVYNFWTDTNGILIKCNKVEYNGWFHRLDYTIKNTLNTPVQITLQNWAHLWEFNNIDTRDRGYSKDNVNSNGFYVLLIYLLAGQEFNCKIITPNKFLPESTRGASGIDYGYSECYVAALTIDEYNQQIINNGGKNYVASHNGAFPLTSSMHPYQLGMLTPANKLIFKANTGNTNLEYDSTCEVAATYTRIPITYTLQFDPRPDKLLTSNTSWEGAVYPMRAAVVDGLRSPARMMFKLIECTFTCKYPPEKSAVYNPSTSQLITTYYTVEEAAAIVGLPVTFTIKLLVSAGSSIVSQSFETSLSGVGDIPLYSFEVNKSPALGVASNYYDLNTIRKVYGIPLSITSVTPPVNWIAVNNGYQAGAVSFPHTFVGVDGVVNNTPINYSQSWEISSFTDLTPPLLSVGYEYSSNGTLFIGNEGCWFDCAVYDESAFNDVIKGHVLLNY